MGECLDFIEQRGGLPLEPGLLEVFLIARKSSNGVIRRSRLRMLSRASYRVRRTISATLTPSPMPQLRHTRPAFMRWACWR